MELKFNLKSSERKSLVGAISNALHSPVEYLGAPTFAYCVGNYAIDKMGTMTGPDNLGLEDEMHQRGFDAVEREYDEPDTYESGLGGMGALPSPEELEAEIESHALRYSEDGYGIFAVEMPMDGFTPEKLDNLGKLIDSKRNLIKAAIGSDGTLPVIRTPDGKLCFEWFPYTENADEVEAYAVFISKLCAAAKAQKRVTATEKPLDNEKFAFRVFLIKLGFVGSEHKTSRRILLRNLSGNSAFKNGTPKKAKESRV